MFSNHRIRLDHGAGGLAMRELIHDKLIARYGSSDLHRMNDGARLSLNDSKLVFTTDSYVIQPAIFPGGDIGKLAVSGTVNDLLVMGAAPRWLSVGMILEEGLSLDLLETVADSIARTAKEAGIEVVTGDTKVVPRERCDGIYINTSGIGEAPFGSGLCEESIEAGDAIIVSGTVGDHAMAVLGSRMNFDYAIDIMSDCAPLTDMVKKLFVHTGVKWMRDPTRGGLAACLDELSQSGPYRLSIRETDVPIAPSVQALCDLLGYDPIHLANEGKIAMVVAREQADEVLGTLRHTEHGKSAALIGEIVSTGQSAVVVETAAGGKRRLQRPSGELLPRIC